MFRKITSIAIVVGVLGILTFVLISLTSNSQPAASNSVPATVPASASSTPASRGNLQPVLITAGGNLPQGTDIFQAQNFLTANGMNLFVNIVPWSELEKSPGQYDMNDAIVAPMTLVYPEHPYKGVLLVIPVIDSKITLFPTDLQNDSFNDPAVVQRFLAMLHAIAEQPSSKNITYILLGNEVDLYLSAHPDELSSFMALLKASIDQLHQDLPGVKVGTIITFQGLQKNLQLFHTLTEYSDFIDYTYYPSEHLAPGPGGNQEVQMEPVSEVPADLNKMAQAAGIKQFGFTEIGYPASPIVGSSPQQQADFVQTVFDTLNQYRLKNRIAFINWAEFADYAPSFCQSYADQQGFINTSGNCAFLQSLGLRTYADNQPREAWNTFVQDIAVWNK
jgi:hypothetical protein